MAGYAIAQPAQRWKGVSGSFSDDAIAARDIFLSSIFLLFVTVLFWIGRVMVRIYLSDHHLSIDAKQRATMAETYLGLIQENVADEKDRNVILTALFRPTTDGIIKDDAAPALSLAGLLSGNQTK